jgi:hypothetical protein
MQSVNTHARHYLERYWGILVLLVWAACLLAFEVIRLDRYGIDEGAARALILNWAVFDRVLNPLITLGVPDFRALLFIPLGAYWSGNILAAKIYTMLMAFLAVTLLYRWSRRTADAETALIACGLLLIFPLFINQVDSIGAGVYLLLTFAVGAWISGKHDGAPRPLGTWFFIMMIWVLITITIHPVGLAYPLALAWYWHRKTDADLRRKRHLYIGLALVVLVTIAMRGGWQTVEWLLNPFSTLGESWHALTGVTGEPGMFEASLLTLALLAVVVTDRRFLTTDLLGSTLLFGVVIGLAAADPAWALIAVTLILFRGAWRLIRFNSMIGAGGGLMRNRALVMIAFFLISFSSMISDKVRVQAIKAGEISQIDRLNRVIALEVEDDVDAAEALRIASQWPGRTMIATRIDTFQLPPDTEQTNEEFLASLRGITHLIFDPQDPRNALLVKRVAELTGATQTLDVNDDGVLLQIVAWDAEELSDLPAGDDDVLR